MRGILPPSWTHLVPGFIVASGHQAPPYDLGGDECHPQAVLDVASGVSETFELGPIRLRVALATEEATVLYAEIEPGAGSSWHTHTKEEVG